MFLSLFLRLSWFITDELNLMSHEFKTIFSEYIKILILCGFIFFLLVERWTHFDLKFFTLRRVCKTVKDYIDIKDSFH